MNHPKYILLLNHCLKRHLLGLSRKEKERFREKCEFLEAGIWDSGVRVKKLKGVSGRVLFEARVSRGDRIIFTLGKHGDPTPIYIWGLVRHDGLKAEARGIYPENAPFLNFEPSSLEEFPDILMDELSDTYFTQEAIEEKTPDDFGPQKWLVLSDDEWKRMLLSAEPDAFEIFLYLTPEQSKVLEADPPLLLSGTAGSGKTTISVYYLLRRKFIDKPRLFLTYHPYLKDFSEKIYHGLVSKTGMEDSQVKPVFYVFRDLLRDLAESSDLRFEPAREVGFREFMHIFRNHRLSQKYDGELVWEEIRSIIKGAKPRIQIERVRGLIQAFIQHGLQWHQVEELKNGLFGIKYLDFFEKIARAMEKKTSYTQWDDFIRKLAPGAGPCSEEQRFLLNEVLRFIEKSSKGISTPLLTYHEYLRLGKKRAPNFLYERRDIYDIAEYYQGKLEELGLWDEVDLCREAILQVNQKRGAGFAYNLVVCDEVQDFTDIQLSLIFRLAKSPQGIVLTGDPKQIINPSGFRWEEVKDKFFERGLEIPHVHHLNLNFRCVGNIVRLANALLDLKQDLVGLTGSELREEWKFGGRPSFLLTGIPERDIIDGLRPKGAGQIILVRDKKERQELKKVLHTELVFTIHEAKGLEFDTVFLWKFSGDKKSADIWRRIKNGHIFDRSHYPHIKHEINLLYVAITRARNTLIIYDSASDVWDIPSIYPLLYRTSEKDVLSEIWQKVSTPEEWERQGDYFFEREYYSAAGECFKNAGNFMRSETAIAFAHEKAGDFKAAATLFEKHGYTQKAALCYESAGLFSGALDLWEILKDQNRITFCRIKLYEQDGHYERAAEEWFKLGDRERAFANWKKAGNHRKMAEYYASVKDYGKAAEAFEKAGAYGDAAGLYKKIKRLDKAADLFFRSGEFDKAIPLYKKLKNRERLLASYVNSGAFYNAGLLCEKERGLDKALGLFKDFAALSQENKEALLDEARRFSDKKYLLRAALRFSALGMHKESAPLFFEKGYYDLALSGFRSMGDHERTAECYYRLRDYYSAALEYEKGHGGDRRGQVTELFSMYLESSSEDYKKRHALVFREADSFIKQGSYEKALVRFEALGHHDGVYKSYLNLDLDEEALTFFRNNRLYDHARRLLDEKEGLHVSHGFLQNLISTYSGDRGLYSRDQENLDLTVRMISTLLKRQAETDLNDMADQLIGSFYYGYLDTNRLPASLLELILDVKNCNAIMEMLKYGSPRKKGIPKPLKSFMAALSKRAAATKDQGLLACDLFLKDRTEFDKILETIPISQRNYKLFAESPRHYPKAVEHLLGRRQLEEATRICRGHENHLLAAQICEKEGAYDLAAKEYRDGKYYEDSIRCFGITGDEPGIAKVYEKMNELDQALTLWRKLGKTREVNRILKKKGKPATHRSQLKLF